MSRLFLVYYIDWYRVSRITYKFLGDYFVDMTVPDLFLSRWGSKVRKGQRRSGPRVILVRESSSAKGAVDVVTGVKKLSRNEMERGKKGSSERERGRVCERKTKDAGGTERKAERDRKWLPAAQRVEGSRGRGRDSKALDGGERGGRAENEERDTKTGVVAAVHTSS